MPSTPDSGYGAGGGPSSGFGSPVPSGGAWGTGYGAPLTAEELLGTGTGFGGGGGSGTGSGGGSPPPSGGGSIPTEPAGVYLSTEAFFAVPLDRRPLPEIGDEGGYLLEVVAPEGTFEIDVPYSVHMETAGSVAQYPLLQPGCYSAVSDQPYEIYATRGGRALRFTTPALPHGHGSDKLYDIVIEGGTLGTLRLVRAVNVLPSQHSLEVISMRSLPAVYKPWTGVSLYASDNEVV